MHVSEVARRRRSDLDWEQQSLRMNQGKGRKDRVVYVSADALAALRTCLAARPAAVPEGVVFWHQKRPQWALSAKGMQQKMERDAQAAGVKARWHSLRHTFAANLLAEGAEVLSIKALLEQASMESSERYATLSHQRVKHVSLHTIRTVMAKTRVEAQDGVWHGLRQAHARQGTHARAAPERRASCPLQRADVCARGVGLQQDLQGSSGHHAASGLASRRALEPVDIPVELRQQGNGETEVDDGRGRPLRAPGFFLWGGSGSGLLPPLLGVPGRSWGCRHRGDLRTGSSDIPVARLLQSSMSVG